MIQTLDPHSAQDSLPDPGNAANRIDLSNVDVREELLRVRIGMLEALHAEDGDRPSSIPVEIYKKPELQSTKRGVWISPDVDENHRGYLPRVRQVLRHAKNVQRTANNQVLDYQVLDGEKVEQYLPELYKLVPYFTDLAERLYGEPLELLEGKSGINVNVVGAQGQQGMHRDRNDVTILYYLTNPNGGEMEYVDPSDSETKTIPIEAGKIIGLVGANEIPHRVKNVIPPGVTPLNDLREVIHDNRIALVFGFAKRGQQPSGKGRDEFLYDDAGEVEDQQVF